MTSSCRGGPRIFLGRDSLLGQRLSPEIESQGKQLSCVFHTKKTRLVVKSQFLIVSKESSFAKWWRTLVAMRVSWLAARRASCLQTPLNEFSFYHQARFSSFEKKKGLKPCTSAHYVITTKPLFFQWRHTKIWILFWRFCLWSKIVESVSSS